LIEYRQCARLGRNQITQHKGDKKLFHVKTRVARTLNAFSDINGNDYVDWEEFTSFCIELGMVSGKVGKPPKLEQLSGRRMSV